MSDPIPVEIQVIKVNDNCWDVLLFAEQAVLKAISYTYQTAFYIDKSTFNKKPMVVIPEFPKETHALAWKAYWDEAFQAPDKACSTCPTVQDIFKLIGRFRARPDLEWPNDGNG